ncbi:MAG: FAD-dependent oxidoreductase [Clostridiales bacterium]|nr:FAD-dependent oxidoreductase [Clostridiales bacterium]
MYAEKERTLEARYGAYDIVVAGGGIAGAAAALAAARAGKKVLLLERMYGLGGLATLGLVTIYLPLCDGCGRQVSFGIVEELLKLSIVHGAEAEYPDTWLENKQEHGMQRYRVRYNAQVFAVLLEKVLTEAGVEILYGTSLCSVIREENRVEALVVENKDGRSAIPAKGFVDATGDADIFYLAGHPTANYGKGNDLGAWFYETVNGDLKLHMLNLSKENPENKRISGLDAMEISRTQLHSHAYTLNTFLENGGVSDAHSLSTMTSIPQLRMTRRLVGAYTLDESEDHASFEDSIGMICDWRKRGPIFEVPFGTLWHPDLVNVAAAGRCISVTDPMWDISRVIPPCAVTGQAAGLALAMSDDLTKLNVSDLQEQLKKDGVKLHLSEIL